MKLLSFFLVIVAGNCLWYSDSATLIALATPLAGSTWPMLPLMLPSAQFFSPAVGAANAFLMPSNSKESPHLVA